MAKSLKEKVDKARKDYLDFWTYVASVTGDTEDMRLLVDCATKYYTLLAEYEQTQKQEELELE